MDDGEIDLVVERRGACFGRCWGQCSGWTGCRSQRNVGVLVGVDDTVGVGVNVGLK